MRQATLEEIQSVMFKPRPENGILEEGMWIQSAYNMGHLEPLWFIPLGNTNQVIYQCGEEFVVVDPYLDYLSFRSWAQAKILGRPCGEPTC